MIDDFAPRADPQDARKQQAVAERLFRGVGNHAGRNRMHADGSLRPSYPPRGVVIATGEDLPLGQSLNYRLVAVEIARGDVDTAHLTRCQHAGRAGLYASAMSGYLQWLAPRLDALRETLPARHESLRAELTSEQVQRRAPSALALLLIGWELFTEFAQEVGALSAPERAALLSTVRQALTTVGTSQAEHTEGSDPASHFMALLRTALATGRAYITDLNGERPDDPAPYGYRLEQRMVYDRDAQGMREDSQWQIPPGVKRIGWTAGATNGLYLEPGAAYAMARAIASEQQDGTLISKRVLWRRLAERNMLASREANRDHRFTIRRMIEGARREVLHVFYGALYPAECGPTGPTAPVTPATRQAVAGNGTVLWDDLGQDGKEPAHETVPDPSQAPEEIAAAGPLGTVGTVAHAGYPGGTARTTSMDDWFTDGNDRAF